MTLADYLRTNGISQQDFARAAGLSKGTVSLLVRGIGQRGRKPIGVSLETKAKIIEATGGAVGENDFELRSASYGMAAE